MPTFGFKRSNGVDVGEGLIEKSYLLDRYPEFVGQYRFAGLYGFGYNFDGQLGAIDRTNSSSPIQTVAGGTNWKQVASGYFGTGAIKTDGTLWMWGYNIYGHLGTNDTTHRSSPVQTVTGGTNWKQVACGSYHTGAIKTDGTLWMWGNNGFGELGTQDTTNRSSPIQTVAGGTNWKQVSNGFQHTAAIKTDGTLWSWGYNVFGQLGDFSITHRSSPVQTLTRGTNWKQVSCGNNHTCAIKTDGTLWVWGDGIYGQLGTQNTTSRSSPIQTVTGGTNWKQVGCGSYHTGCIKTDGTLWMWGYNSYGQLGTNDTTLRSSPVQTVTGGTNWKQVAGGEYHASAIKTDGTLWVFGRNDYGQLGANDTTSRSSPIQTVTGGTNWKQVSCGSYHTSAIKDDSEDLL